MVGNPEAIALRYFAGYTQKWLSSIPVRIVYSECSSESICFSRAKGATHEALLFLIAAFCRRENR
jgi:hypothetical protein